MHVKISSDKLILCRPLACCLPCSETPRTHQREGGEPEQQGPESHVGASVSAGRWAPVSVSVPLAVNGESAAGVEGELVRPAVGLTLRCADVSVKQMIRELQNIRLLVTTWVNPQTG